MIKKYIQVPKYITQFGRVGSIRFVEQYINENIDDFRDGEIIGIEYYDESNEPVTANAIVKIDGRNATVYASVTERDTIRVVESDEEPRDKSVIWISDDGEGEDTSEGLKQRIAQLDEEIRKLKELTKKHDYALSSTLAGGDIILNSEKYERENEYDPEKPEDATDYTEYAEDDLTIDSFELYIAGSPLTHFSPQGAPLYAHQNYFIKLKLYNVGKEEIKNEGNVALTIQHDQQVQYLYEKQVLIGLTSGYTTIFATINDGSGTTITNTYPLHFEINEKPGYEPYSEPNVKHFLLKSVKTYQILKDNFNYLCVNEPIWCIGNCSLYIKGEMPDGNFALFRISGSGGDDPEPGPGPTPETGETAMTIFNVDQTGNLTMDSIDGSVYVDETGVLVINTGKVDNGILVLEDVIITGSTSGDTSGTTEDTSTGVVDDEGNLDIEGKTFVEDNILILNASITSDGILEITS